MQTGREVVSGSRSQAWSQCCHYLKRPKATSPIPPCALKFHPRPVRTHIQDQKAPVLFYTAAPVPTYCFDLISLISGTWEFLLFFPSSEFKLCIYSFALVLCYILICSQLSTQAWFMTAVGQSISKILKSTSQTFHPVLALLFKIYRYYYYRYPPTWYPFLLTINTTNIKD